MMRHHWGATLGEVVQAIADGELRSTCCALTVEHGEDECVRVTIIVSQIPEGAEFYQRLRRVADRASARLLAQEYHFTEEEVRALLGRILEG